MAYNKSKHIDAAQKYLSQGKLQQAISEYQQILKHEPKDQVTLMTLGDLFVRKGETFQALEYFERLAKLFLSDGFTAKAIAIYKKVGKLAPEETRPLERLAELYVQQGVLSEARPLFLQLAEVHLRAGRQAEAAGLFRKLLAAEPDNLRVQTRLGDLQLAMGQTKEALQTFCQMVGRVLERGDHAEAARLADRALQVEPHSSAMLLLKARAWSGMGKFDEAAELLEPLPESKAGGEVTTLLLENYAATGQHDKAVALAEHTFEQDPKQYARLHQLAAALIDAGRPAQAQELLARIHDPMIDAGEHEVLAPTLARLAEALPGEAGPLERLAALYAKVSDSFQLVDVLARLARVQENAGNDQQALISYEQLLDRTPENEPARLRYNALRDKMGLDPVASDHWGPVKLAQAESDAPAPPAASAEPSLDEATNRFISQALTDVDLLSSYGLTEKAIDLLESVLPRAPHHTPVLERLLDLSVGAGKDARTAELAAQLEQLAIERNDRPAAERYSEFRRRYQRAAGISPTQPASTARPAEPPEFAVPVVEAELAEAVPEIAPLIVATHPPLVPPAPVGQPVVHEVDLSEEWAALSQQLEEAMQNPSVAVPELTAELVPEPTPELTPELSQSVSEDAGQADEVTFELEPQSPVIASGSGHQPKHEPVHQPVHQPEYQPMTSDMLLSELAGELESSMPSLGVPSAHSTPPMPAVQASSAKPPEAHAPANGGGLDALGEAASTGPLGDLFESFRSDMDETNDEDEDPETHYSLGVAYREMGLLDEAISEFQRVAHAGERGKNFRHAMQCCTLLGLAFMEKGQPGIAAMWYERALLTPGLDQQAILALRYDLGVAQEVAGEATAAYKSFSQVYAMNIDYRDVAERVAALSKVR